MKVRVYLCVAPSFLEYVDESAPIPKNTSLLLKRVPTSRPGGLSWYGTEELNQQEPSEIVSSVAPIAPAPLLRKIVSSKDEQSKLEEVLRETQQSWRTDTKKRMHRPGAVPPPGYTCFRCGQPGHYIQDCPTNNDPNYNVHRAKRPTGIPLTFLKPVKVTEVLGDSKDEKGTALALPGGGFAMVNPQESGFKPNQNIELIQERLKRAKQS